MLSLATDRPRWSFSKSACGYRVRDAGLGDLPRITALRAETFGELPSDVLERMRRRDHSCHHIVVEDEAGAVVGSYRLTCTLHSTDFDSGDSFDLKDLLAREGTKLELSYACVSPAHRHGPVIRLLLSAIRDYCSFHGVNTIFGCASLGTTDKETALKTYDVLTRKKDGPTFRKYLAPLLRFYFHLGAIVIAPPLLDPDFKCFDFCMMLDLSTISDGTWLKILGL